MVEINACFGIRLQHGLAELRPRHSVEEKDHAKLLDAIVSAFPDTCDRRVESWFNGRSSKVDPF